MRRIIICILMVFMLVGCDRIGQNITKVDVQVLDKHTVRKTITFPGIVQSANIDTIVITDIEDCPVKDINVRVGDLVEAGEVICVLDTQGRELADNQSKEIIATQSGVISNIFAVKGLCPTDGMILSITNMDKLCAEVWIGEEEIYQIQEGLVATISSVGVNEIESFGNIENVSQLKEEEGFRTIVSLERNTLFKIGMDIQVKIEIDVWENVLAVEKTALQNDGDRYYVLVANKLQEELYLLEKREIYSLSEGDSLIAIDLGDVEQGEYVVTDVIECHEDDEVLINITKDK